MFVEIKVDFLSSHPSQIDALQILNQSLESKDDELQTKETDDKYLSQKKKKKASEVT